MIGKALIENKNSRLNENDINVIFRGKAMKGFMHKNYANKAFYSNECMELDCYRKNILKLSNPNKMALAFTLIRRAMIRKMPYSRFTIPWKKVKELRNEQYSYRKYGRSRAYHNQSFKEHFFHNLNDYNNAVFDNGHNNKDELKKESCREFNEIKCMVENIAYPILIASHIKPWRKSTEIGDNLQVLFPHYLQMIFHLD